MPSTTPLTDAINALTTYSNTVTGASDTTLSDAVATLAAGYGGGGGTDPMHLKTATELVIVYGAGDWSNNHPTVGTNGSTRRSLFSLDGTSPVYYNGTLTDLHLIEIPSGATTVTVTLNKSGQFAVREYIETDGVITGTIATTGWLNNTANTGASVTLSSGTKYLVVSTRVSSSNNGYDVTTIPTYAKVDFS